MKMDIRDKDGQYTADIELPGCKKEDIAIELNNGYLTVTANSRYENDEKATTANSSAANVSPASARAASSSAST